MTRFNTLALAALAAGCAFDNGPARDVPLGTASDAVAGFATDLGWQVTLTDARLYVPHVEFLDGDEAWVGELAGGDAIDLLAASQDLGQAIFQPGSQALEALVRVGPPETGQAASMHSAGLYLAGSAVPPGGGDPVDFTAALPIDADVVVADLALAADDLGALTLEIHSGGWLDGIDFSTLPGGAIVAGSTAAAALEAKLADGSLDVTTGD